MLIGSRISAIDAKVKPEGRFALAQSSSERPWFDNEEVAQVSDEQKIEEELESEDDVEAHSKVTTKANDEGPKDDDGDVEAHIKVTTK
jgi:hypothetical protein